MFTIWSNFYLGKYLFDIQFYAWISPFGCRTYLNECKSNWQNESCHHACNQCSSWLWIGQKFEDLIKEILQVFDVEIFQWRQKCCGKHQHLIPMEKIISELPNYIHKLKDSWFKGSGRLFPRILVHGSTLI